MENKNSKIVIIDYGAGNVQSVANILGHLGVKSEITNDASKILNADKIIFPGQGHFKQAMEKLGRRELIKPIKQVINEGKSFLGICLGLQVLFEKSEEAPDVEGLGVFEGEVKKFTLGKTPQIGWNKIEVTKSNTFLTPNFYYFVNSYYVIPKNAEIIASNAFYGINFCSSVQHKNVTAVQFHPEKSSIAGALFFKKWLGNN